MKSIHQSKFPQSSPNKLTLQQFQEKHKPRFHNPADKVKEVVQVLERWHILPDAGGWLDQDPKWLEDIRMYLSIEADIPENLSGWFGNGAAPKRPSKDEQMLKNQYERFNRGGG